MNSFSKVLQVVFMVVLLPIQLIGQERQWHEFELDKIKINFPTKEVFQLDTVIAGVELKQLYARFENSTLIIQKISANDALGNKDLSSLPYDHKSLIEYYNGIVDGANDSYKAEEIKREEIKLGVLIGYRATYYDGTGTPFVESNIFLAGEELISISFHNLQPEIYQIKEAFLSSLNLENLESLAQYQGRSKAYRIGYLIGQSLGYLIIGVGFFFLIKAFRKKKKSAF